MWGICHCNILSRVVLGSVASSQSSALLQELSASVVEPHRTPTSDNSTPLRFNDIWVYFHVYLILLYRIWTQSLGNDQNVAWFTWCPSYGLGRHGFRQGVVAQQRFREVAILKGACFPYTSYLLGNLERAKCSGVPQQRDSSRCACDPHESGGIVVVPCRPKYLGNIMPREWCL